MLAALIQMPPNDRCSRQFFNDQEIADKVAANTVRYHSIVKQAIDAVMPSSTQDVDNNVDVTDILYQQRIAQLEEQQGREGVQQQHMLLAI